MKTLGLISCTKKKKNYSCNASEMYSPSELFSKAYAYCSKNYTQVAILSAKYGLVSPKKKIEPYNLTLNRLSAKKRKAWSEKVFKQMQQSLNLSEYDKVFVHAGNKYREYLIPILENAGLECEVPLSHLGIGEQLKWYKLHLKENTSRSQEKF